MNSTYQYDLINSILPIINQQGLNKPNFKMVCLEKTGLAGMGYYKFT